MNLHYPVSKLCLITCLPCIYETNYFSAWSIFNFVEFSYNRPSYNYDYQPITERNCINKRGEPGTCIPLSQCEILKKKLKEDGNQVSFILTLNSCRNPNYGLPVCCPLKEGTENQCFHTFSSCINFRELFEVALLFETRKFSPKISLNFPINLTYVCVQRYYCSTYAAFKSLE